MLRLNGIHSAVKQRFECKYNKLYKLRYKHTNVNKHYKYNDTLSLVPRTTQNGWQMCNFSLTPAPRYLSQHNMTHKLLNNDIEWFNSNVTRTRTFRRHMSNNTNKQLTEAKETPYSGLTTGEKIREVGKDATYTGIIIVGVCVTGFMFYTIFRELMSGESPTGVYRKAFKLCKKCTKITDILGEPLKGYGEENRRGRRRHVRHHEYEVDGVKHMRLIFYVEGPRGKGTVQLEVKKNASGHYEYRYLFVQLDNFPQRTIVLEDNR